jgi:hypothetical protein
VVVEARMAAACLSYQGALTTLSPLLGHGMSRLG